MRNNNTKDCRIICFYEEESHIPDISNRNKEHHSKTLSWSFCVNFLPSKGIYVAKNGAVLIACRKSACFASRDPEGLWQSPPPHTLPPPQRASQEEELVLLVQGLLKLNSKDLV